MSVGLVAASGEGPGQKGNKTCTKFLEKVQNSKFEFSHIMFEEFLTSNAVLSRNSAASHRARAYPGRETTSQQESTGI